MAKKDHRTFYDHRMFFIKKNLLPCILFLTSLSSFQGIYAAAALVAPAPPGFGPKPPPGPTDLPAPILPPQQTFPQVNPAHLPQIIGATGPIQAKVEGSTLKVQHDQARMGMGFSSFNIAQGHSMNIHATYGPEALTLLQVSNASRPANIDGFLKSNAGVLLISPNGIVIGPNGTIDTHSFIASTQNLSDYAAFLAGSKTFHFDKPTNPMAHIANRGTVSVNDAGFAAFVSPGFGNAGIISGNVYVGAGERTDIDLTDDGLIKMRVTGELKEAVISQTDKGKIHAHGKTVFLTTSNTEKAANNVINLGGEVDASGGEIIVLGGEHSTANVSATLSTAHTEAKGGTIEVGATKVSIEKDAILDASGKTEGGFIRTHSQELDIAGKIITQGETGQGGYISLFGNQSHIHETAHIDTFGAPGGTTRLFGDNITIDGGAHLESSGHTDGGTVFIGGYKTGRPMENTPDFQVFGPRSGQTTHHNAHTVNFKRGAMVTADSYGGDAGEIYLIAEGGSLTALGSTSVSAFGETGNGGWGEYSILKSNQLIFEKSPIRTSKNGKFGTFHLDPQKISVVAGDHPETGTWVGGLFGYAEEDPFTIGVDWIINEISNVGNFELDATEEINFDVELNAPDAAYLLTVTAGRFNDGDLNINAPITIGKAPIAGVYSPSPGLYLGGRYHGALDKAQNLNINEDASITVYGDTKLFGTNTKVAAPVNVYSGNVAFWNQTDVTIDCSQPVITHNGNFDIQRLKLKGSDINFSAPKGALILRNVSFDTDESSNINLNKDYGSGTIRIYDTDCLSLASKSNNITIGGGTIDSFISSGMTVAAGNILKITSNVTNAEGAYATIKLSGETSMEFSGNASLTSGNITLTSPTIDLQGSISTPGSIKIRGDDITVAKPITKKYAADDSSISIFGHDSASPVTTLHTEGTAEFTYEDGGTNPLAIDIWAETITGSHLHASVPDGYELRLSISDKISMDSEASVELQNLKPYFPDFTILAPKGTVSLTSPTFIDKDGNKTANLQIDTGTDGHAGNPAYYGTINLLNTGRIETSGSISLGQGVIYKNRLLELISPSIGIFGTIKNATVGNDGGLSIDASAYLNMNWMGGIDLDDYSLSLSGKQMAIDTNISTPGNITIKSDDLQLSATVTITDSTAATSLELYDYDGSDAMPVMKIIGANAKLQTAGKPIDFNVTDVSGTKLTIAASLQDAHGWYEHTGGKIYNSNPVKFDLTDHLQIITKGDTSSIELDNVRLGARYLNLEAQSGGSISLSHANSYIKTTNYTYISGGNFTINDSPTIETATHFHCNASKTTTTSDLSIEAGTYIEFYKLYAEDAETTSSTITLTAGTGSKIVFGTLDVHDLHLTQGKGLEFRVMSSTTRDINIYGNLTSTSSLTGDIIFKDTTTAYDWTIDMRNGGGFNSKSLPGMNKVLVKENVSSFNVKNGTFNMPLTFEGTNTFSFDVERATISNDILPAANNPAGKPLTLALSKEEESLLTVDGGTDYLDFDTVDIQGVVTGAFNFSKDITLSEGGWLQPTDVSTLKGDVIVKDTHTGRITNPERLTFSTDLKSVTSENNGADLVLYSESTPPSIPKTGLDGSIFESVTIRNPGNEINGEEPIILTKIPRTKVLNLYPKGENFFARPIRINADLDNMDLEINAPFTLEVGANTTNVKNITFNSDTDTRHEGIIPLVKVMSNFSATGDIDFKKSAVSITGADLGGGLRGAISIESTGGDILSDYFMYSGYESQVLTLSAKNIDIMQRANLVPHFHTFSAHAKNNLSLKGSESWLNTDNLLLKTDARVDPNNGTQSNIELGYSIQPASSSAGLYEIDSGGTVTIDATIGDTSDWGLVKDVIIKANKGGVHPSYLIQVNANENNHIYGNNITIEGSAFNWWGNTMYVKGDLSITTKDGSIILDPNNTLDPDRKEEAFAENRITSNKATFTQEGAGKGVYIRTPMYGGSEKMSVDAEGNVDIDEIIGHYQSYGGLSIKGKSIAVNNHLASNNEIKLTSTNGGIDVGAYFLSTVGTLTVTSTGGDIVFDQYKVGIPTVTLTANNADVMIKEIGEHGNTGHNLTVTGNNITVEKGPFKIRDSLSFTANNSGSIIVKSGDDLDQFNFAKTTTFTANGGGGITLHPPSFGGDDVTLDAGTGTLNLEAPVGYDAYDAESAIKKLTLKGQTVNIKDKISAPTLDVTATGGKIELDTTKDYSIKSNKPTFKTLAPTTANDGDILLTRGILGTGDMVVEAARNIDLAADIGSSDNTYSDIKISAVGSITTPDTKTVNIYGNKSLLKTTGNLGDIDIKGALYIRGSITAQLDAKRNLVVGSGANTGLWVRGADVTLRGRHAVNLSGDLDISPRALMFNLTPVINLMGHSTITTAQGLFLGGAKIIGTGANLYNLTLQTPTTDYHGGVFYGGASASYPSLNDILGGSFANVSVETNGGILMTSEIDMKGDISLTSKLSRITLKDTSLGIAHPVNNINISGEQGLLFDNVEHIKGQGSMVFTGDISALNVPVGGIEILNYNGDPGDIELKDTIVASDGLFKVESVGIHNIKLNGVGTEAAPIDSFTLVGGTTYLESGGIYATNDIATNTKIRTMKSAHTFKTTTGDIGINGWDIGSTEPYQRLKLDAAGNIDFNTVAGGASPVTVEVINGKLVVGGNYNAEQSMTIIGDLYAAGDYTYRTSDADQQLTVQGRIIPMYPNLDLDIETHGNIAILAGIPANDTSERFQSIRLKPGSRLSVGGTLAADENIELLTGDVRLLSDTEINTAKGQIIFPAGPAIPTTFNSDTRTSARSLTIQMNSAAVMAAPAHNFIIPTLGETYALGGLTINTRAGNITADPAYPIYIDGNRHLTSTGTININNGHADLFRGKGIFTIVTPNALTLPDVGQHGRGAITTLDLSGATGGVSVSNIAATTSILLPDHTVIRGNSHLSADTINIDTANITILDEYLKFTGDVTLAAGTDIQGALNSKLQVSGKITSPGSLRIRRPITLNDNTSFEGTTVIFDEPINADHNDLHIKTTLGAVSMNDIKDVQKFSLVSPVDLVLDGLEGINEGFIESTGGNIILTDNLMDLKNIRFKSPVRIRKAGDMLIDITGSNTRFDQGIDWENGAVPGKLTINAKESFDILQGIGIRYAPEHVVLQGNTRIGANVYAQNSIAIENAVNLIADTRLHAPIVKTLSSVDGPYSLSIEETRGYIQGGTVGGGSRLREFRWDSSSNPTIAYPIHAAYTRIGTRNMNFGPASIETDHLHIVPLHSAGVSLEGSGKTYYPFNITGEQMRSDQFKGLQRFSIGDPLNLKSIIIEGQFLLPNVKTHLYGNPIIIPVDVHARLENGDLIQYVGHIQRSPRHQSLVDQMQEHVADAHQSSAETLVHHVEQPDVLPMKIIPHEDAKIDASDLMHDHDAPISDMGINEEENFGVPAIAAAAA